MNDEVMTIPEVARYLKLSKSKVYQLAKERELPTFRVDKSVRVLRTELERWIESQKGNRWS